MKSCEYKPLTDFVYRPSQQGEPIALAATIGCKFSNDTILLKSFLDQFGIPYEDSDLEMTPLGLGYRIKRD